eukprot:3398651-Rhodomonas_salina.1
MAMLLPGAPADSSGRPPHPGTSFYAPMVSLYPVIPVLLRTRYAPMIPVLVPTLYPPFMVPLHECYAVAGSEVRYGGTRQSFSLRTPELWQGSE